jgi:hypothetical protein
VEVCLSAPPSSWTELNKKPEQVLRLLQGFHYALCPVRFIDNSCVRCKCCDKNGTDNPCDGAEHFTVICQFGKGIHQTIMESTANATRIVNYALLINGKYLTNKQMCDMKFLKLASK